jgi:hypothetical protein
MLDEFRVATFIEMLKNAKSEPCVRAAYQFFLGLVSTMDGTLYGKPDLWSDICLWEFKGPRKERENAWAIPYAQLCYYLRDMQLRGIELPEWVCAAEQHWCGFVKANAFMPLFPNRDINWNRHPSDPDPALIAEVLYNEALPLCFDNEHASAFAFNFNDKWRPANVSNLLQFYRRISSK